MYKEKHVEAKTLGSSQTEIIFYGVGFEMVIYKS